MVNKKIVVICSVIALIVVLLIIGFKIKDLYNEDYEENTAKTTNSNIVALKNTVENTIIQEQNTVETNDTEKNETTEQETKTENETVAQNEVKKEEVTSFEEQKQDENNKEKALRLVKEEWGKDDTTVYFTLDNQQGNFYYYTVRSKSTTASLAEYEVDVTTSEVNLL